MDDNGDTKDDVKLPDGEVGDKIKKLFVDEGKETSKQHPLTCLTMYPANICFRRHHPYLHG